MEDGPTQLKFSSQSFSSDFHLALREHGFAVIEDHTIDLFKLNKVYYDWSKFFSSDEKKKYRRLESTDEGYVSFLSEQHKGCNLPDYKEFFQSHFQGWFPDFINLNATKLILQQFFSFGERLVAGLERNLPKAVADGMQTPMAQLVRGSNMHSFRVIHYAETTKDSLAPHAAAHTDICLLTIMPCPSADGLFIKNINGDWFRPKFNKDSIIVFNSDMLEMATNGYFQATEHKVNLAFKKSGSRYSFPIFIHPFRQTLLAKGITALDVLRKRFTDLGYRGDLFEG